VQAPTSSSRVGGCEASQGGQCTSLSRHESYRHIRKGSDAEAPAPLDLPRIYIEAYVRKACEDTFKRNCGLRPRELEAGQKCTPAGNAITGPAAYTDEPPSDANLEGLLATEHVIAVVALADEDLGGLGATSSRRCSASSTSRTLPSHQGIESGASPLP
jgi:hypothetical protein